MSKSNIEWTGDTPNPVIGCTKQSAGCKNCYAIRMAWRLLHSPHPTVAAKYAGTVKKTENGELNWTGRINYDHQVMRKVIANKKPTVHFVNSMGDLFHPNVPFKEIDIVFAAMAAAPWHTYQVLTKHPDRALEWFGYKDPVWKNEGMQGDERIRYQAYHRWGAKIEFKNWKWPLPQVWIGTSVENQQALDERGPLLLQIPAAVRFFSCEPLLGPLNLRPYLFNEFHQCSVHGMVRGVAEVQEKAVEGHLCPICDNFVSDLENVIDWVIVGGESGHKARPVHPDWIRQIIGICDLASVSVFFKQWGEYTSQFQTTKEPDIWMAYDGTIFQCEAQALNDTKKRDIVGLYRIGKKKAGHQIDGKAWQEIPKSRTAIQTPTKP